MASKKYPPRSADEDILEMLHLRKLGKTPADIAPKFGTTQQNASFHTVKIMKADLAESGEPAGIVRAGYWA